MRLHFAYDEPVFSFCFELSSSKTATLLPVRKQMKKCDAYAEVLKFGNMFLLEGKLD